MRLVLLLSLAVLLQSAAFADNGSASQALNEGRIDDATRLLRSQLQATPHDAVAHQLLCRAFYSEELADAAIHECEPNLTKPAPGRLAAKGCAP